MNEDGSSPTTAESRDGSETRSPETVFVKVDDVRPEGYDGTCLRPLGLCELGGCCDACWYRPDHPRFLRSRR